jgi:hypothetical protein
MIRKLALLSIMATVPSLAQTPDAKVAVPFVGCPSEGQAGPLDPPIGSPKLVALPAVLAEQIAFYEGRQAPGAFAPRGWHCQVVYGSSGGFLVVTPTPPDFSRRVQSEVRGRAVEVEYVGGEGSGRFRVAAYADPESTRDVLASLPHANDSVSSVTRTVARFTTPAHTEGMGTDCSLAPGDDRVRGVAILHTDEGFYLTVLRVRLGSTSHDLEAAVLRLNERCIQDRGGC